MRVIFMGTPDFALAPLAEIFGRGHEIVAVYTRRAESRRAARAGADALAGPCGGAALRSDRR